MARIIIDAGHGGETDSGAVYQGRMEKDDNLSLALEVGQRLANEGYDVVYTRQTDVYQTPVEKARLANEYGGDWFISFHRNSSPSPNTYSGAEVLVYNLGDQKEELAESILTELEKAGYRNLGVKERPGLAVLRRTSMPSILIETGFINTDQDNAVFDSNFDRIASAIVDGIDKELTGQGMEVYEEMEGEAAGKILNRPAPSGNYRIQLGAYRVYSHALNKQYELINDGYPADLLRGQNGIYTVSVGGFHSFEDAQRARTALAQRGYEDSFILK